MLASEVVNLSDGSDNDSAHDSAHGSTNDSTNVVVVLMRVLRSWSVHAKKKSFR